MIVNVVCLLQAHRGCSNSEQLLAGRGYGRQSVALMSVILGFKQANQSNDAKCRLERRSIGSIRGHYLHECEAVWHIDNIDIR